MLRPAENPHLYGLKEVIVSQRKQFSVPMQREGQEERKNALQVQDGHLFGQQGRH